MPGSPAATASVPDGVVVVVVRDANMTRSCQPASDQRGLQTHAGGRPTEAGV
jgi:hypothetical protein